MTDTDRKDKQTVIQWNHSTASMQQAEHAEQVKMDFFTTMWTISSSSRCSQHYHTDYREPVMSSFYNCIVRRWNTSLSKRAKYTFCYMRTICGRLFWPPAPLTFARWGNIDPQYLWWRRPWYWGVKCSELTLQDGISVAIVRMTPDLSSSQHSIKCANHPERMPAIHTLQHCICSLKTQQTLCESHFTLSSPPCR